MTEEARLRIGEFSRRVGEAPELLRAWEARYGLPRPERTVGGLRLYSEQDERRVRAMRYHIDAGLSSFEAARLAKLADDCPLESASAILADIDAALERSFETLDEPGAQAALDRLLAAFELRQALAAVILPCLRRLGDRWACAQISVAEEHFASAIISGRLHGLAQGWGLGIGPRAVLACPPGELHELGLLSFGLALRERGWRIAYLGADTPLHDVAAMLDNVSPAIVVVAAVMPQRFLDSADELAALAAQVRVGLGGAGASVALADRLGVEPLVGGLIEIAADLTP